MKHTKIILSCVLSSLLVLQGCGGGSTGNTPSSISEPQNAAERITLYSQS